MHITDASVGKPAEGGGIFSDMFSYPSFDEVCDDLGDKVIGGITKSATCTAGDLRDYRKFRPLWVSRSSERGLANWIHDRMWDHLVVELDRIPNVTVVDREPLREISVGTRYRLRVKRHHPTGTVSTYPTLAALEFFTQGQQMTIEGLEEIRLITGYLWESDLRQVGVPVLSLRDGRNKIVWMEELPITGAAGGTGTIDLTPPPSTGPVAPVIEVNQPSEGEVESE